jgi:NitT/TauT family transport system permease protein
MKSTTVYQLLVIAAALAVLEVLCVAGVIDRITMPPPHRIAGDLARMLLSGSLYPAIGKTLANVALAFVLALLVGIAAGTLLHGVKSLRAVLDPLFATYYAIPVFALYPLLIVFFGLGDGPQILIGAMLGVVAVIVNTLNGLDRVPPVLKKTARIARMGPVATALTVTLPHAAPYLLAGAKLALAYALIGVIGAEFIMSHAGIGYEISFAYLNFDNATMYPLIVLILLFSILVNSALSRWERALLLRRGQA